MNTSSTIGIFLGVVAVTADVVILLIPLPVIVTLQMALRRKVGVVLLFMSGILYEHTLVGPQKIPVDALLTHDY